MLNLSQFINEYVFIFNIQIWPNRPGHPTDLPFRSKTLKPKCVKLIMRTGAITKPCTSKPDRNIRKSSSVITGAGVWQEKIKKWKPTVKVGTCCDFWDKNAFILWFCDRNWYIFILIFALNFSGFQLFGANIIYKNMSTKNNTLRPFQLWTRAIIKILCKKP